MKKQELIDEITEYLSNGGLFNPELMDHAEVQRLLIDIRDYLLEEPAPIVPLHPLPNIPYQPWVTPNSPLGNNCPKCGLKLEGVMGYVCSNPQCPTGLGGTWCSS